MINHANEQLKQFIYCYQYHELNLIRINLVAIAENHLQDAVPKFSELAALHKSYLSDSVVLWSRDQKEFHFMHNTDSFELNLSTRDYMWSFERLREKPMRIRFMAVPSEPALLFASRADLDYVPECNIHAKFEPALEEVTTTLISAITNEDFRFTANGHREDIPHSKILIDRILEDDLIIVINGIKNREREKLEDPEIVKARKEAIRSRLKKHRLRESQLEQQKIEQPPVTEKTLLQENYNPIIDFLLSAKTDFFSFFSTEPDKVSAIEGKPPVTSASRNFSQ